MARQRRVEFDTVVWGGRELVPVQYVADDLITLREKRYARRLWRAGTVDIIAPHEWHDIQSTKGPGLNLDPGYVR